MTNDDNYGPWIDWAGGECPIPDAKAGDYQLRFSDGEPTSTTDRIDATRWDWSQWDMMNRITAYRVRLPADDILRQAIEALRALQRQALQSSINDGNEWGEEALEMTRTALALAKDRGL